MARRGRSVDGQLLGPLGWCIAALAASLVPHVLHFPVWMTALAVGCGGYRWRIELGRGRLPPVWLRLGLALSAFVAILALYRSINGIVPGTALLVVMAALKLLETRRRRDLYVIVFIALFLILAAVLREQEIWSLPYLLAALLVTGAAWVNIARVGAALPAAASLRVAGRMFVHALPLMLVFWVLFPRVPGPFWSIPASAGSGVTGISNSMSPGDISSLSRSDEVAFRVRFDGPLPPASALYWRGPVMHRFNGRTWSGSEPLYTMQADRDIHYAGEPTRYTVTLEPTGQFWLFALDIPRSWTADFAWLADNQQLVRRRPIDDRLPYSAVSHTDYRIAARLSASGRDFLATLPPGFDPRARALARQLRSSADSDADYVDTVLRYFREQPFFYTLQPPTLGRDSVDEFLFKTRRGFCEHYASAFAVLMRAAGIPTRVVAGYHGGDLNPVGDYLIVRQSNAHAWNEVWLEGEGWRRVDPTAAVSALRIEQGLDAALEAAGERRGRFFLVDFAFFRNMGFTWDAVRARWEEWVLGYGPETQQRFMRWLGIDNPNWQTLTSALSVVTLLCLGVLALTLARRYRPAPADAPLREYRRLAKILRIAPQVNETPGRFAERAASALPQAAPAIRAAVERYQALRYAGDGSLDELRRAIDALSPLAARARARAAAPRPRTAAAGRRSSISDRR